MYEPETEKGKIPLTEDLLDNTIMELASNMRVLTHPDVDGIRVRPNVVGQRITVDIYVYRITESLRDIVAEEFDSHRVLLHHLRWGLIFT